MNGSLEFLVVEFGLDRLDLFQGDAFSRLSPQYEKAERPDLEFLRVRVFQLGGGSDFAAQRAYDHRL